MFGYVRPSDDRLTPADRETFRAAYCGLCHALGARYGLVGRMILNYDLTFWRWCCRTEQGRTVCGAVRYIRCGSAAVRQATRRWTRRRT